MREIFSDLCVFKVKVNFGCSVSILEKVIEKHGFGSLLSSALKGKNITEVD